MRRNGHDLRISGLTASEARSLAADFEAAAVAVVRDRDGTLLLRHARNDIFEACQLETVIQEWVDARDTRNAYITLLDPLSDETIRIRHISRRQLSPGRAARPTC